MLAVEQALGTKVRKSFESEFLAKPAIDGTRREVQPSGVEPSTSLDSDLAVVDIVSRQSGAIGYVSMEYPAGSAADDGIRIVPVIRYLAQPIQDQQGAEQAGGDEAAITAVLDVYRRALESKDFDALAAVWPAISSNREDSKRVTLSFELTESVSLDLTVERFEIRGDRAAAYCLRQDHILLRNGQEFDHQSKAVFHLQASDEGWKIESIEAPES